MFPKSKNELKITQLNRKAIMPTVRSDGAAGLDLYACLESDPESSIDGAITIPPNTTRVVHTGVSLEIPKGYFGGVFPRNGLVCKRDVSLSNCIGVIESDYDGEVLVALRNNGEKNFVIWHGDFIAKLILIPHLETDYKVVIKKAEISRGYKAPSKD